eukprot:4382341-Lingulodinium_polyedra.AAC.1
MPDPADALSTRTAEGAARESPTYARAAAKEPPSGPPQRTLPAAPPQGIGTSPVGAYAATARYREPGGPESPPGTASSVSEEDARAGPTPWAPGA